MSETKEWERIQMRAFTKWVNSHLRKRNMVVEDMIEEFETGVPLIHLYEVISDESLGNFYPAPKMKFHKIANLNKVVDKVNSFIEQVGIRLQFSAEQILNKEKTQILGMIWCLIHKFEIQDISEDELSAREGLLLWCKKKTKGYPNVNVKDFKGSWQDGLAFCALIHKHRPDLLDFDSLDPQNPRENLQKAFDVAEKQLDIPQLLDVDDMIKFTPDDKAVMTYVAYYWKRFASSNRAEKAGRKLAKVAKRERELENMKHDYEQRAKKLVDWIDSSTDNLSDPTFDHFGNSLDKAEQRKAEFKQFKDDEKPNQSAEKVDLEMLLTKIRNKQKNEGLPIYNPPTELGTDAINDKWNNMNTKQDAYDKALREHITLMKRLEILLSRFRIRAKKISEWQDGKNNGYFTEDLDKLDTISALQAKIKIHETFDEEVSSVDKSLQETGDIGKRIIEGKHEAAPEVNNTMDKLNNGQQDVKDKGEQKAKDLDDRLKKLEELLGKCLDYAKKAENLAMFLDDISLALAEPITASSVKDVDVFVDILEAVDARYNDNAPVLGNVTELYDDIKNNGGDPNLYSGIDKKDLEDKFKTAGKQIEDRKKNLEQEKARLSSNEDLLQQFAAACDEYTQFSFDEKEKIISLRSESSTLEEQLEKVKTQAEETKTQNEQRFSKLLDLFKVLEEREVLELSSVTQSEMQAVYDNLEKLIEKTISEIESEILASKNEGIPEEQLKDWRETFKYFDKDKDGRLTKADFKACVRSLGEDIEDNEIEKVFHNLDIDRDGFINFDEFLQYMRRLSEEGSSYEDVIESFRQLAGEKDYITEGQLRSVMEPEEAEFLLKQMPPKEGTDGYDYIAYAKNAFAKQ
ncbi:hypothetical protein ABK040_000100 [Willaertia magna]